MLGGFVSSFLILLCTRATKASRGQLRLLLLLLLAASKAVRRPVQPPLEVAVVQKLTVLLGFFF